MQKKQLIMSLVVCGLVAAVCIALLTNSPAPRRRPPSDNTTLVVTEVASQATAKPVLRGTGTLASPTEVTLRAQVAGMVTFVSSGFVPGKAVKKGELLVKIDPRDAQNQVAAAQAQRKQALASLEQVKGAQNVAVEEANFLKDILTEEDMRLAQRQPQLESAQSALAAADADLALAKTTLSRTRISASHASTVLSRSVGKGDVVSVGTELGEIVGVDEWWVTVELPIRDLPLIQKGATARVRMPGTSDWYAGSVLSKISASVEQAQLGQVLVTIPEPLQQGGASPLLLRSIVEVEIDGTMIAETIRVPRANLRGGDQVWVMNKENALEIRQTQVLYRGRDYVYLKDGVRMGEKIVTSPIATPVEGMELRDRNAEGKAPGVSKPSVDKPGASSVKKGR